MAISTRWPRTPVTAGPFAFDGHSTPESKAEFGEELDGGIEVFHHDADVVHALDRHDVSRCLATRRFSGGRTTPRS